MEEPEPVEELVGVDGPEPVGHLVPVDEPELVRELVPVDESELVEELVPVEEPEPVRELVPVDESEPVGELRELEDPEPAEMLLNDLHEALPMDVPHVDAPAPEREPLTACLAFAPTTDGYRLVALDALPEPGETIDVPEVGERVVLRIGRSPIPADDRLCAFVEEPVTAPMMLAVH